MRFLRRETACLASPRSLEIYGNMATNLATNHTRSVVVRGSANYRPIAEQDLDFYFYSYERAGTFGFRCAADAVPPNTQRHGDTGLLEWSG